ncbi:MAG: flippase [Methanomassiliicoccus sp.]|nr:flippase [Methanomassiliicoccus sp.]
MGLARDITKNALAMALVQATTLISTFILSIFLARYLGTERYGIYTLAFSLSTLIFFIADFNLGFQLVVEVAPNKEIAPRYLTSTLLLRVMLGAVALFVTLAVTLFEGLPPDVIYAIMAIAVATYFNWLYKTFTSMYMAYEQMHYVLWTSIAERMFTIPLAILLLVLGFGLPAVVLVTVAGAVLQFVLGLIVCSRFVVRPSRRLSIDDSKAQLRKAVPYATLDLAINSLFSVNAVLLQSIILWLGGGTALALSSTAMFNLPFNMVTALVALPTTLIVSLVPVVSRTLRSSKDLTQMTQQKVMKYMFILGLPIGVGGIILANKIILFFYGPEYAPAGVVFAVLMPAVALSFFDVGMGSVLASAKRIRLLTVANCAAAVVNIALCFLLVPFYHEVGAAIAFTVSYFVMVAITFVFLCRHVFRIDLVEIVSRPVGAAIGMAAVLLLLPDLGLFVSIGLGAALYFIALFLFKGLNKQDRDILRAVLNK